MNSSIALSFHIADVVRWTRMLDQLQRNPSIPAEDQIKNRRRLKHKQNICRFQTPLFYSQTEETEISRAILFLPLCRSTTYSQITAPLRVSFLVQRGLERLARLVFETVIIRRFIREIDITILHVLWSLPIDSSTIACIPTTHRTLPDVHSVPMCSHWLSLL